jgi:hypothetical protein
MEKEQKAKVKGKRLKQLWSVERPKERYTYNRTQ